MAQQSSAPADEQRWTRRLGRSGLAVVLLSLVLVIVSSAQVAYRLTLPTEGWAYSDEDEIVFLFTHNLLGGASPLRPGDRLVAVEGVGGREFGGDRLPPPLADDWRAGQEVRYTVERDNVVVDVAVPLRHWTASAVLRNDLGSVRGVGRWLAALLMLGIGVFVLSKRPDEAPARTLLLLSSVWFSSEISYVLPFGPTTALSRVMTLAAFFGYWIFGVLIGPTVLALALVFPWPKVLLRRIPWLIVLPYLATLFQPLRRRIQGFIDRRFYRRKYDAARTLQDFGVRLRDEVDLDGLRQDLIGVVQETV